MTEKYHTQWDYIRFAYPSNRVSFQEEKKKPSQSDAVLNAETFLP